jgi:probable HAF family extracellular repeat protein
VTSTSPSSAARGSTLDVRVLGRSFELGSTVAFALDGVGASRLQVNSTRFLKASELVANVTISADAAVAQYDVVVTLPGGERGSGTDLFGVASIVDLGLAGIGDGRDVNSAGIVVGDYLPPGNTIGCRRAFAWSHTGALDLPTPQTGCSSASAINDAGVIVGHTRGGAVLRWIHDPTLRTWQHEQVPAPSGFTVGGGGAVDVNEAGVILAVYTAADGTFLPFLRLESGWVQLAITSDKLCWNAGGFVAALNSLNQVVGGDCESALIWPSPESPPVRLPFPTGVDRTAALDINDAGSIAGKSRLTSSGARRAVRWIRDEAAGAWTYEDIGDLASGAGEAGANSINNAGDIAGWSTAGTSNSQQRGFLWTPGLPMRELGSLASQSAQALALSNPGVGGALYLSGWSINGSSHRAVRWSE